MTTNRTILTATVAGLAALAVAGCSSSDDAAAEQAAGFTPVAEQTADIPDGAVQAATDAAEACEQVDPAQVVALIKTRSGYDTDFTASDGSAGIAGMYPVKWDTYGTGDLDERNDLDKASQATAAELCDAYSTAEDLADDGVDGTVEELALEITLVGEDYTARYGVPADDAEWDPHDVRAAVTTIQDTTEQVDTDQEERQ